MQVHVDKMFVAFFFFNKESQLLDVDIELPLVIVRETYHVYDLCRMLGLLWDST